MPYKRKPRALKRKYIKRRTGARAQSKQIMALSKTVGRLTKANYETICTVWNRPTINVDKLAQSTYCYICPIPISMCNTYSQNTVPTQGNQDQRIQWTDSLALAAMDPFKKNPLFGSSENARDSPEITHTGSYLKYRLINEEPSFSTYTVFLVQPKKRQANQLTIDRTLKSGSTLNNTPGAGASFTEGVDFITHPDVLGTEFNKKYWKVLYKRIHNFSHPGATGFQNNASSANTRPRHNAILQEGSMKIPGGTVIRNFNRTPYEVDGSPNMGFKKTSASQIGILDEPPHATCYLAIVNNGASVDGETVKLAFLVKDYYKAVV